MRGGCQAASCSRLRGGGYQAALCSRFRGGGCTGGFVPCSRDPPLRRRGALRTEPLLRMSTWAPRWGCLPADGEIPGTEPLLARECLRRGGVLANDELRGAKQDAMPYCNHEDPAHLRLAPRTFTAALTREHQQFIENCSIQRTPKASTPSSSAATSTTAPSPPPKVITLLRPGTHPPHARWRVILSSGNHDSFRCLGYGAAFFEASGVSLRTTIEEATRPVELTDWHLCAYTSTPSPLALPTPRAWEPTHRAVLGAVTDAIRADAAERHRGEGRRPHHRHEPRNVSDTTGSDIAGNVDTTPRSDRTRTSASAGSTGYPPPSSKGFDYVSSATPSATPSPLRIRREALAPRLSFSEEHNATAPTSSNSPRRRPAISAHEWAKPVHMKPWWHHTDSCSTTQKTAPTSGLLLPHQTRRRTLPVWCTDRYAAAKPSPTSATAPNRH